mgnify:CR=1 FL=1
MRLMIAIPEANVKKPVLDGALEAVTRLNEDLIRSGASPTSWCIAPISLPSSATFRSAN